MEHYKINEAGQKAVTEFIINTFKLVSSETIDKRAVIRVVHPDGSGKGLEFAMGSKYFDKLSFEEYTTVLQEEEKKKLNAKTSIVGEFGKLDEHGSSKEE